MRTARAVLAALGLAAMAYAIVGAAGTPDIAPTRHAVFGVVVLVAHDAVLLPAVVLVGAAVRRFVPVPARATVQAALVVTAAVTFVAVPLVVGAGRTPDNPSALPRDYPRGLAVTITVIWLGAGASLVVGYVRRRTPPAARRAHSPSAPQHRADHPKPRS